MKFLAGLLSALIFATSIPSFAFQEDETNEAAVGVELPAVLECQFKRRYSRDWEDVSDFTWNDYEWVLIKPFSTGGYVVQIGAMSFGDSFDEGMTADQIVKVEINETEVIYTYLYQYQSWTLRYNPKTKHMTLFAPTEGSDGKVVKQATFQCE